MQKITFFLFTQDKSSQLIFAQNLDDKHGTPQRENHISTDNNPRVFRTLIVIVFEITSKKPFVGMIEDFGRLLTHKPIPVFILLGFHFLIKASVVICFAHSEHLLQNRNSRLISFENQAAM